MKLPLFHGHLTVVEKGIRNGQDKAAYPAAFREQIVDLARAGKGPAELSREFGPTAQSIANWIVQAARDAG